MTWLYVIGYVLIGIIMTVIVIKSDPYWYLGKDDAFSIGFLAVVWPLIIAIVIGELLGALIIRISGRKAEFLSAQPYCGRGEVGGDCNEDCYPCVLKWLNEEATPDD